MKIAILSMQRVINYGSFLQAYSLKSIIEAKGHEVVFIDIKDKNDELICPDTLPETGVSYYVHMLYRTVIHSSAYCASFKREHMFRTCLYKELGLKKQYNSYDNDNFDLCIIGSDEVFNCCQESKWKESMHLFGKDIKAKKIITYAASFGHTTFEDLEKADLLSDIKKYLSKMDMISVRDQNSYKIVERLVDKSPVKNIDPVFLSDYKDKLPQKIKRSNYILVYGYDGRLCEKSLISKAKDFAKQKNLKLIALGMAQEWCDETLVPNPFELLEYFKKADYVITDTFHGTVFSIKYQKQFVTLIRNSNKEKLTDLLQVFELTSRMALHANEVPEILEKKYDTLKVTKLIEKNKLEAEKYLEKYLGL